MKATARFESNLDIRSSFDDHINLALLLKLFLTKEQTILFKHHRMRAVSENESGKDDEKS